MTVSSPVSTGEAPSESPMHRTRIRAKSSPTASGGSAGVFHTEDELQGQVLASSDLGSSVGPSTFKLP